MKNAYVNMEIQHGIATLENSVAVSYKYALYHMAQLIYSFSQEK